MSELTHLSLAQLSQAYRDKSLSPVEVTKACLARIDSHNDKVNAFVTVCAESALAEAEAAEAEIAAGGWRGPLHGVPIGHKDLYQTAGIRSTSASRVLENHVPEEDATSVARLKAAGVVMLGKLNTHEFAYGPTNDSSMFGPCRNPWDTDRFSGGSSGGSGAAVALGMCAGATGSDTGGSIRIPSACCGITGLKPTYGRSSRAGIFPLCWTMDHAGPMTRSAEDAALMFQPMPGPDGRDATVPEREIPDYAAALTGDVKGLKIGVPKH
jgi:aspartyl-tRNA(Asn)/glutamyl-tRNA(Gln) amidotransferase subunit A